MTFYSVQLPRNSWSVAGVFTSFDAAKNKLDAISESFDSEINCIVKHTRYQDDAKFLDDFSEFLYANAFEIDSFSNTVLNNEKSHVWVFVDDGSGDGNVFINNPEQAYNLIHKC